MIVQDRLSCPLDAVLFQEISWGSAPNPEVFYGIEAPRKYQRQHKKGESEDSPR
jgi:hypothetical protein